MLRPTYPPIKATLLPELVGLVVLAGLCSGTWAVIMRGQYFGPLKGVLTAVLALVSFNTIVIVIGAAVYGWDINLKRTLGAGAVATLWGGMFFWWILLPVGLITGALYRKSAGELQPRKKREYVWAAVAMGVFPAVYATAFLLSYDARTYEVPAGFSGAFCVEFNNPACPVEKRFFKNYVIKVDTNGRACTGVPFRFNTSTDELYEISGNQKTRIPTSRLRFQTHACAPKDVDRSRSSNYLGMEVVPSETR
jgi:hypothetical protein